MALEITKSIVAADEELNRNTVTRDRDDFQKEMDGEVGTLVSQWLDAEKVPPGKLEDRKRPEDGAAKISEGKRPRARYHVGPTDKTEFKDVLRRAGTLHKVEVVFLYPKGLTREPVDEKTGKAAVTITVAPRSAQRKTQH